MNSEPNPTCFGYYIEPLTWIDQVPRGIENPAEEIDYKAFGDEMVRRDLMGGLLPCRVDRDGLVMFEFSDVAPQATLAGGEIADDDTRRRIEIINAHQACLLTAMLDIERRAKALQVISTPHLLFRARGLNLNEANFTFPNLGDGRNAISARTYVSWDRFSNNILIRPGSPISLQIVELSLDLLDDVLAQPEPVTGLVDLLYRASVAFVDYNFSLSLIQAWAVCEALLQEIWGAYVKEQREQTVDGKTINVIGSNSVKRLTDSSDTSIAVVMDLLALQGLLPRDLHGELSQARKARNKWIHRLTSVDPYDAIAARQAASHLLSEVHNIKLEPAFVLTG